MKIGILGGTFDPPHLGHIQMARAAMETLELDEVIFIPTGKNPLKKREATHPKVRFEMTRLAIEGEPKFLISDIEQARKGLSYTVDTLSELQFARAGEYWVIMGTDSLKSFEIWKNYERIMRLARLAVIVRLPQTMELLTPQIPVEILEKVDVVPMDAIPYSSTEIRVRIEDGKPVQGMMSEQVRRYVESNRLYRS